MVGVVRPYAHAMPLYLLEYSRFSIHKTHNDDDDDALRRIEIEFNERHAQCE